MLGRAPAFDIEFARSPHGYVFVVQRLRFAFVGELAPAAQEADGGLALLPVFPFKHLLDRGLGCCAQAVDGPEGGTAAVSQDLGGGGLYRGSAVADQSVDGWTGFMGLHVSVGERRDQGGDACDLRRVFLDPGGQLRGVIPAEGPPLLVVPTPVDGRVEEVWNIE